MQEILGPGWKNVVLGGRVLKNAIPPLHNSAPGPVTETHGNETTTSKGKTVNSAPKVTYVLIRP